MRRRGFFGSHLYSQIVAPLLGASVIVALLATLVAVYFLRDLTDKWVAQVAQSSTANLVFRTEEFAAQMQRVTAFAANTATMRDAIVSGDAEAITSAVTDSNRVLGFDSLMVLDSRGRVVAANGEPAVANGERPVDPSSLDKTATIMTTEIAGVPALVASQPMTLNGEPYYLVSTQQVDNDFLTRLGVADDTAFCFYTDVNTAAAHSVGTGFTEDEKASLDSALKSPDPAISAALADVSAQRPGRGGFTAGGHAYQLWAAPVDLPGSSDSPPLHLVGVVSQQVSEQAGATTTNLIAMWSVIAVLALVGLGGFIARRVSDPLVELAAGARRIADGDFTTKVDVRGANEITELAETFNAMTDSLHERSDALTKKVLELATLYEMSRALGSTLELDELLESVLESALRIFDLDLGYVTLRDKETGQLAIRAVHGEAFEGGQGAVRSSMSEWVVREGRPLIFNPDPTSGSGQIDVVTGAKAALCVPLVSAEGTIGSITIGSTDPAYRFNSDDVRLLSTIANHVTIAIGNIELFTTLQEAYLATVRSLAAAVDAKDTYTRGHSDRVAQYATYIAERMGLGHEQRIALEMAAYLHDIGKIGVKEEILLKPGRLDDDEMAQMRHHPLIGANILKPVAFPWAITPIVRHHHEYYDGTGYPAGLRGEEIPLLARILTVADSFEAMTADRPYRAGMAVDEAIVELRRCAGGQFDPGIVLLFTELIHEFEADGESITAHDPDDVAPEEARAVFSALVDGLFVSFRKLGGPRLATNVESEVDAYLEDKGLPFRIVRGRIDFSEDVPFVLDGEVDHMRLTLRRIDIVMGRLSGQTLVDHFYADALAGFSDRMRELASELEFFNGH